MPVKAGLLRRFVDWIESGYRTPEDLLLDCLEKIRALDGELEAWVEVAPQPALGDGPLRGIPFGAKDIFEACSPECTSHEQCGRDGYMCRQMPEIAQPDDPMFCLMPDCCLDGC